MIDFTVDARELKHAMEKVRAFVPTKTPLPITKAALMVADKKKRTLTLYATNLDAGIEVTIDAKVKAGGRLALGAKGIAELIRSLSGDVRWYVRDDIGNNAIAIDAGETTMIVIGQKPDDFPAPVVGDDWTAALMIDGDDLSDMIKNQLVAVCRDDTRPTLAGIQFMFNHKLSLASTDGFRLSLTDMSLDFPCEPEHRFLVPWETCKKMLTVIGKDTTPVMMEYNARFMGRFSGPGWTVTTRLIEGTFPNVEHIIPKVAKADSVEVPIASILGPISKVRPSKDLLARFEMGKKPQIVVVDSETKMGLSAPIPELPTIAAGAQPWKVDHICFKAAWLAEGLARMQTDTVLVQFAGSNTAAMFSEPDGWFRYIIMPVYSPVPEPARYG